MQELQQHTGKLKIENYGLWEFLQDFQQGVSQGYELDESNEGFPQVFGSLYTCLLKPKALKQSVEGDKTPSERIFEEVICLRKELKELQESTVNSVVAVEVKEEQLVSAPFATGGELPDEQKIVGEKVSEQPTKRGPKPKN